MNVLASLGELEIHGNPDIFLTFGNYDGVHLGHQKLLLELLQRSKHSKAKLVVMTFLPHPRKILQQDAQRFLISNYLQRRKWLEELGVDFLVEVPFNRGFSLQSATDFINNYVLTCKNLKKVFLGWDFAFGANKEGDAKLFKTICNPRSVDVEVMPAFKADSLSVSSSMIREALRAGSMPEAKRMLGRCFAIQGLVVRGEGRGRRIGVPTANLQFDVDLLVPAKGVYVTETNYKGLNYRSVTNIGHNPTFSSDKALTVETHLIGFSGDLYGEMIEVSFLQKIRDEKKFSTVNELIEQLNRDIETGKRFKRD
jgi:riboflavin kinase/FMN adenylyltransferase